MIKSNLYLLARKVLGEGPDQPILPVNVALARSDLQVDDISEDPDELEIDSVGVNVANINLDDCKVIPSVTMPTITQNGIYTTEFGTLCDGVEVEVNLPVYDAPAVYTTKRINFYFHTIT